jgi:DNA repair exonuclease SbcCD ATPase subunit
MQEDDLQAAREKAARARERHQQEQEQRRRKLWPRKDEGEEGAYPVGSEEALEQTDSLPGEGQADLPGLRDALSSPDAEAMEEDWEEWMEEEEPEGDFYAGDEFGDPGRRDFSSEDDDGYESLEDDEGEVAELMEDDVPEEEEEPLGEPGELSFYQEPAADPALAAVSPPPQVEHSQKQDEKKARLDQLKDEMERIERERRQLESLRRKQEEYERAKATATSGLKRQLGVISREISQMEELSRELETTRTRFTSILSELESIQEDSWTNSELEEQLGQAIGRVELAREEMSRAESRLKLLRPEGPAQPQTQRPSERPAPMPPPAAAQPAPRGGGSPQELNFSDLVRRGLAYSLPGIVTALFLFLLLMIFLILQQSAMIY